MTEIRNDSLIYQVGEQVAETGTYRLYLCLTHDGRQCLLQIAIAVEHNGVLQRAAYILNELYRRADEVEAEYARVKKDPSILLNYHLGFPALVDSFICQEQGGRHVNILAFTNVDDVAKIVPLTNITQKDRLRVDLKTSAWIMGKLLKLLAFASSEGFSVNTSGNNILIEPDQHYVLIFDWSVAQAHQKTVPMEIQRQQIIRGAQAVIAVLGGDPETGTFPDDGDDAFSEYTGYLLRLARGERNKAKEAHEEFYALVDKIWERGFHPFTARPLVSK